MDGFVGRGSSYFYTKRPQNHEINSACCGHWRLDPTRLRCPLIHVRPSLPGRPFAFLAPAHIPTSLPPSTPLRFFYPHSERFEKLCTKTKGKLERKRAKTTKFCACGGRKGHYNSSIQSVSVKSSILIIFGLKRREAANFFGGVFVLSGGSAVCPEGAPRWMVLSGGCPSGGCRGRFGPPQAEIFEDFRGCFTPQTRS